MSNKKNLERWRDSRHYYAVFRRTADPADGVRAISLGVLDLTSAKGQVTRMINRGASHAGYGAVAQVTAGLVRLVAIKDKGVWKYADQD